MAVGCSEQYQLPMNEQIIQVGSSGTEDQVQEGEEMNVESESSQAEEVPPPAVDSHFQRLKELLASQAFMGKITFKQIKKHLLFNSDPKCYTMLCYIFQNIQNADQLQQICLNTSKGICSGPILQNQQTYICEDCGRETDYHIYCSRCFEQSLVQGKHIGHRFKAQTGRSGCCDCGDIDSIEKNGFCSKHCGQIQCDQKMKPEIEKRIQQILYFVIDILFFYCDEHTSHLKLFGKDGFGEYEESMLELENIEMFLTNIVNSLSFLIVHFCKNKLPLQIFISELMLKPFNRKLRHCCETDLFEETFSKRTEHVCQDSIVKLLFKYSISLNKVQKHITDIFYSLSVNPQFKSQLSNIFLESLNYVLVMYNSPQTIPVVTIFHIYFVYCQFLCGERTDRFISHPGFARFKAKTEFMINLINTKYYGEFNNTITLLGIYERINEVVKAEKREELAFKMMEDYLEVAPKTCEERGRKFDHHRFKTILMNHFLNVFASYVLVVKYCEQSSKPKTQKMIRKYFRSLVGGVLQEELMEVENPEQVMNQKQNQKLDHESDWESYDSDQEAVVAVPEPPKIIKIQLKEEDPRGQIKFGWYCLPQLQIGTLLANYFNYHGKEALAEMLLPMKKQGSLNLYIKKLVQSLTSAYTIGKSKEVGFPQQYPPKDLYKYFYKYPTRLPFDCIVSVLQILAIVSPEEFIQEIEELEPAHLIELLSDVLMEESAFVNLSTKCSFENKLAKNSLKIQIINILNLKNKISFADMKKNFLQEMFSNEVSFNEIISEVAIFDAKTQTYTAKDNFKGLEETVLVRRAENVFGNFFDVGESILNLIQKGSLFKKQIAEGWVTLCSMANESLGKTGKLAKHLETIINQAWKSEESSNHYTTIELIYVILLRNINDECLRDVGRRILDIEAETNTQKLVHEILLKLDKESVEVTQKKKVKESPVKSNNKMKMHLERLKKQQQKFIQNNPTLFKEIQEDQDNEAANHENICLICQQGKIENQYPVFLISSQFQVIEQLKITTYMSCGHLFHTKCLANYAAGLCPVCKHLYENTFPLIPQKQITMLNPKEENTISCNLDQSLFRFSKGDPIALRVVEMTFSKIYFATLESCSKFVNKDLKQLRSVYSNYVLRTDKRENFITVQELIGILQKRVNSLMNHQEDNEVLFNLLYRLLLAAFDLSSLKMKELFDECVSVQYTSLFADYVLGFVDDETTDYLMEMKLHEEALNGKMTEFCKAVVFTYALIFDDPRNEILSNIQDQTKAGGILKEQYPQFLCLKTEFFNEYMKKYLNDKKYLSTIPESIIPVPYTIPMPQNYMEFHKMYYDLICDECAGVAQFYNNELWLCLLCGYRCCLTNCSKLNYEQGYMPSQATYAHFNLHHYGSGIGIEMNSGLIGIVESSALFQYGYLYENAFGEHNNNKIKQWSELRIQTNRWSKLMDLLKKRTMRIYVVQQNLKGRIFNPQAQDGSDQQ